MMEGFSRSNCYEDYPTGTVHGDLKRRGALKEFDSLQSCAHGKNTSQFVACTEADPKIQRSLSIICHVTESRGEGPLRQEDQKEQSSRDTTVSAGPYECQTLVCKKYAAVRRTNCITCQSQESPPIKDLFDRTTDSIQMYDCQRLKKL